ncbi:hypothetical protein BamIOP4010DRAFT_6799 [Burkholderia ambifaria IOP40-10]|uniref:Uncharacterized protein n=1 Tax=Burkholderia ambifaria IOP40-10 TaxID=396596 RepID=B1FRY6_9BURK|nr:hypothetical protein BamIOP4010DRAFT_6799 [Burkholderia ambifaria IOP40-10]
MTPCIVNSASYCAGVSTVAFGRASWMRITSASTPPSSRNAKAVTM